VRSAAVTGSRPAAGMSLQGSHPVRTGSMRAPTAIWRPSTANGTRRQLPTAFAQTDEAIPVASVLGSVTDDRGRGAADYTVVIFPENRDRLLPPSPFVRNVRSAPGGNYRIDGLPPADYLAIAVDSLAQFAATSPEVLERLLPQATPFRLDEGEQQALNLRLARTPVGLPSGR